MNRKLAKFLLVVAAVVLSACGKAPDLSRLQVGGYYVAQWGDKDVVLCVEEVSRRTLAGRWYVEDGAVAQHHSFSAQSRFFHREELLSDEVVVHSDAMPSGDILLLDMLLDDSWQTLSFQPWQQPPLTDIDKKYLYHDNLYQVVVDTNIAYAYAKGYWASYPEPKYNCDDYFTIVMEKLTDLEERKLKYLYLDMDVYTPITDESKPRPLLMLIHGGAFFNGDKQSAGYKEWGRYFAARGYVVASINYRIGFLPRGSKRVDRAGYRAVQDARAAMCYLLRHPERYPIDPNRLFVAGSSAGGITALNLAFMTDKDRPESTKGGVVHEVANELVQLFTSNPNQDSGIGLEDLGDINAVAEANAGSVDFHIDAVVNMWGAVHKIEMIDTSQNTAILSFHGDADSVVAYGYDHPFTKVKMKPLNEFMCNKMYGSKCIHERAKQLGMVSELHTKAGGGHSLHAECGELTDYYTLITDTTTRFLYLRMFPRPEVSKDRIGKQQWYKLENAGEWKDCCWEAIGGLVLEVKSDKARVLFFDDAEEHKLHLSGHQKNGQCFDETYNAD